MDSKQFLYKNLSKSLLGASLLFSISSFQLELAFSATNTEAPNRRVASNTGGRNQTSLPANYKQTKLVEMCIIPLPTPVPVLGSAFQHVFMRLPETDETYGMPLTRKRSYFGGESVIDSPDPFYWSYKEKRTCAGVYIPQNMDEQKFYQRFKCITEKFSDKSLRNRSAWRGVLDYHWQENNCHSAVHYMLDCAGGTMSMSANGGLGSDYDPNKKASIEVLSYSVNKDFELFPKNVDSYVLDLEGKVGQAFLDGNTKISNKYWAENRQNIMRLFDVHLKNVLSDIRREQLIENYTSAHNLGVKGFLAAYDKFVGRYPYWQEGDQPNPDFIASSFMEMKNSIGTSRSLQVADKYETDYKGVCEQARKECF